MKLFTNEYPWRSIISIYAPWHEKITIQLLSLMHNAFQLFSKCFTCTEKKIQTMRVIWNKSSPEPKCLKFQ